MNILPMVAAALAIVALLLCAGLLRRNLEVVTVLGNSMEPALLDGDRVLVRRCTVSRARRGDIVLLHLDRPLGWPAGRPVLLGNGGHIPMLKRLVGLPGEALPAELRDLGNVFHETVVPADGIVVLGDNGASSKDSRQHGYLPSRWVAGKVIRRMTR
ncbi:S26 family signal peptidase [Sphaerisporangium krabiense]|uniref:signal peptidase I n=1 Tax=Sphaerisporangium krabiense TaxID=763782 RepID=A0A7W8Z8F6_9ACTN|nr:S26 family signal peptidase [Sphaerisporangium krabiense]MBB5629397.1 signal peptidase I [Sphaerisporangium krabiense]GII65752.1 S26 family signal peptidase [Sphaerisporangium krabiense]